MFDIKNVTIDDLKKTGIDIDWNFLINSIKATIDNYERIESEYSKSDNFYLQNNNVYSSIVKKSTPYLNIVQIVNDFAAKASAEQVALVNFRIAYSFMQTSCHRFVLSFLEKSFYYYKEHLTDSNFSIFFNFGYYLMVYYERHGLLHNSLLVLKYCLEVIEKREGVKGNDYCRFLYNNRLKVGLYHCGVIKSFKWFIGDFSITDSSFGKLFYQLLCFHIQTLLKHDYSCSWFLTDEERCFWIESYDKYSKLYHAI